MGTLSFNELYEEHHNLEVRINGFLSQRVTKRKLFEALTMIVSFQRYAENYNLTSNFESDHEMADKLLLKYINDSVIINTFDQIRKWYA